MKKNRLILGDGWLGTELVKQTVFHAPSNSVVVSVRVDCKVIPKLRLLVCVRITKLRDSP